MINLLPPDVKRQVRFAKWNTRILKNTAALIIVGLFILGFLSGAHMYAESQAQQIKDTVKIMTEEAKRFEDVEKEAENLSDKLVAIETLLDNQRKFSVLLTDIADVMPTGARLTNISLTGDETTPLAISAEVDSQIKAGILRNALITSDRFSAADIQSVSRLTQPKGQFSYRVSLVLAFSEGGAR